MPCLCQDIALVHRFTNVHRYGTHEQAQDGVDFTEDSPEGVQTALQVRRKKELTTRYLETNIRNYTKDAVAICANTFVVRLSIEANDRKLQDKLYDMWCSPSSPSPIVQRARVAVNRVPRHSGHRHPGRARPFQHAPGQLRLGRERHVGGQPRRLQPRPVLRPVLRGCLESVLRPRRVA